MVDKKYLDETVFLRNKKATVYKVCIIILVIGGSPRWLKYLNIHV